MIPECDNGVGIGVGKGHGKACLRRTKQQVVERQLQHNVEGRPLEKLQQGLPSRSTEENKDLVAFERGKKGTGFCTYAFAWILSIAGDFLRIQSHSTRVLRASTRKAKGRTSY